MSFCHVPWDPWGRGPNLFRNFSEDQLQAQWASSDQGDLSPKCFPRLLLAGSLAC